jgi:hypothetical protein
LDAFFSYKFSFFFSFFFSLFSFLSFTFLFNGKMVVFLSPLQKKNVKVSNILYCRHDIRWFHFNWYEHEFYYSTDSDLNIVYIVQMKINEKFILKPIRTGMDYGGSKTLNL